MALTPAEMDRKIDEHFGFEARDDVEGVLATLAPDAEHDIVGWPTGPTHGREGARRSTRRCSPTWPRQGRLPAAALRRRLPGRRVALARHGAGRPFGLDGRGRPLEFRLLHVVEFAGDGAIERENVWIDLAAIMQTAAAGLT